ncbi:hypothetical protein TraAM80_05514 [Trypanosoma rangeli]|uniref:Uncharacterized protein n=1 Tax=Trypanosoma rangeli TaxID=5698 RepID=A0A3R7KCN8_TRYRA|nr:uncharacterized protein TraAM80_05514 [Trypanosoma rangeli]RNF03860.1 hypothetical protein TraAM80_05514 [Trypanosoma rangeli]|eukprot:RNF03860.1 hypothetical protein TraAM80_05514 [Trypanosoma rangeli]
MEGLVPPEVWRAVQAFLEDGSVEAGVFMRDLLRRSTYTARITRQCLPPLLFREAFTRFSAGALPASFLLLVAILNRLFCMQAIPDAMTRPINDERPTDFADLLLFYLEALRAANLPAPVMEQLYLCVSVLLLLQSDVSVVESLCAIFGGAAPETTRDTRTFTKLLVGVMSVLSDSRVAIGPVRRSAQRMCVQKNMHLVLAPSTAVEDVGAQAAIIVQGVSFLSEGNVHEPQEIAPLFWTRLSASSFWRLALERLRQGAATEAIVEAVCAVLRAITVLDASAVSLLLTALEAVLDERTQAPLLHVCCVITSSLESVVEEVVVQFGTDHVLYQALAAGALTLKRILEQPKAITAAPLDFVPALCESLSVLSQVLSPLPVPEMDPTDDPDDYAMVVEGIQRKNKQKEEALLRLEEFLKGCLASLLVWLEGFSAHDVNSIALYVGQNDNDEFAVWHDEPPVAFFTTYERLCALLSPFRDNETQALAARGCLTVAAWDAELSYLAVMAGGEAVLHRQRQLQQQQPQQQQKEALLLPVVVSRHQGKWSSEQKDGVISSLAALLRDAVMTLGNVATAAAICESLRRLNAPFLPGILECLWQGLHLPCGNDKAPRCMLASYLSMILEQGYASLPPGALENSRLDDYSLAELRSCTLSSPQETWSVMELLQRMDPDAAQSRRVAERITMWVQAAAAKGLLGLEQYTQVLQLWYTMNPLHFSITWRLMRVLQPTSAAGILADALERFVSCKNETGDVNWGIESDCFSPYVLDTIAASPHAPRLHSILCFLIASAKNMDDGNAQLCLRAVVRGGIALLPSQHCSPIHKFELFYAAAKEYIKLCHGLWTTASSLGADADDLLRDVAKLGTTTQMVGVKIPLDAPVWLQEVRNAIDEFDIQRILKCI